MSEFVDAVIDRLRAKQPITVIGAGSRGRVGPPRGSELLSSREHQGIVAYEPTELVLTAKAGTRIEEIDSVLAKEGQMLAFEPPRFSPESTLGGLVASGLAGPRRVAMGGVRDHVLGVRLINGLGEHLRFGGEVMKNVAGFDVSRLQVGAFGTLGVLTEISMKVLPRPGAEETRAFECTADEALSLLHTWGQQPLPISASHWQNGTLYVRLSGTMRGVAAAALTLGGQVVANCAVFWHAIRDPTDPVFHSTEPLWRLAVPSSRPAAVCPLLAMDWHGGQRWTSAPMGDLSPFVWAEVAGGHARCEDLERPPESWQQPLAAGVARLNRRVKLAMDPHQLIHPVMPKEGPHAN